MARLNLKLHTVGVCKGQDRSTFLSCDAENLRKMWPACWPHEIRYTE